MSVLCLSCSSHSIGWFLSIGQALLRVCIITGRVFFFLSCRRPCRNWIGRVTACYSLPQHQSALGTSTIASQWLCNIASGGTGKYRITGKGIFSFFILIACTSAYSHMCITNIFTIIATVATIIVINLSKL